MEIREGKVYRNRQYPHLKFERVVPITVAYPFYGNTEAQPIVVYRFEGGDMQYYMTRWEFVTNYEEDKS